MTLLAYDSSIAESHMSNQRYSPEFKDEAVRQVVNRGYSVPEVAERLGVSSHSLYKWIKAVKPDNSEQQAAAMGGKGNLVDLSMLAGFLAAISFKLLE
jgi:transposase-like protein